MPCKNKEKRKEYQRQYDKKYRKEHKEKIREYNEKYRKEHKEEIRERRKIYRNTRYYKDPLYRLNTLVSSSVYRALKGNKNGRCWETLVNYSLEELKEHLEQQFSGDMTWDNYGTYWHIDHIVPKSVFNYTKAGDYEFKLCWALSNLQPMKADENLSKHNKLDYYIKNPIQSGE